MPLLCSNVANKSALGVKNNQVHMFASLIGYFHDNLYVDVSMNIFIVSWGDFKWLSLRLYATRMFADGVTTFM